MATNDADFHCCDYLKYRGRSIRLVFSDRPTARRWALFDANGDVDLQVVMFCPFCGHDFRADLDWRIPGRPQENEIFEAARQASRSKPTYDIQTDSLTQAVRLLSEQLKNDSEMSSVGTFTAKCHNGLNVKLKWPPL